MSIPKISVIIPFYNHLNWVKEAVDSVLAQTFTEFEIILVDDGSSEDIQNSGVNISDPRIKYIRKQNSGPGATRNVGIDAAQGKYIAFLDSDDLFEPMKLEKQIAFMEESEALFSHTPYITFDEAGNTSLCDTSWFKGNVFNICLVSSPLATPTIMIRRDALEHPRKRFAEHMRFGQDGYLWMQLLAKYKLFCVEEYLSRVRLRGNNAAIRARVQLQVKAQILEYMEEQREFFLKENRLPKGVHFLYKLCRLCHRFIEKFSQALSLKQDNLEILSRVVYFPLWIGFKYYKMKMIHQSKF